MTVRFTTPRSPMNSGDRGRGDSAETMSRRQPNEGRATGPESCGGSSRLTRTLKWFERTVDTGQAVDILLEHQSNP